MPRARTILAVLSAGLVPLGVGCAPTSAQPSAPVRIVLLVADGAGVEYWSAAWLEEPDLAVADFPVVGLLDPGNLTLPEPESASSATALAIGEQTVRRVVGLGADLEPRTTVLEAAEANGLATGLVTTTALVDATPAAFAAHTADRYDHETIARQIAEAGVEVLLGDGEGAFATTGASSGGSLLDRMRDRYEVVTDAEGLAAARGERLLGLFAIDSIGDPARRSPSLEAMTRAALGALDRDPDGFFLLVETEHTDHRGHDNAPLAVIRAEMLAFDRAIRAAIDYRDRHPETLVLVVSDHETGGLTLAPDSTGAIDGRWATGGHTAALVPLFAIGPGAERFAGIQTNAEIGRHLLEIVGGG